MTSAQSMLKRIDASPIAVQNRRAVVCRLTMLTALTLAALSWAGGCASGKALSAPTLLVAPYGTPRLWAVAPLRNESGVSLVEPDLVADALAYEAEQIAGIDTVPVNRVIAAMRQLNMRSIESAGQVRHLMQVLGVDGIIVGTVTAYGPYPPLSLGVAIELYGDGRYQHRGELNTVELTRSPQELILHGVIEADGPMAQAAGMFEAANHKTLRNLATYAAGRHTPDSAYGSDIYLVNMDLYTRFVSNQLLETLLAHERRRITALAAETTDSR